MLVGQSHFAVKVLKVSPDAQTFSYLVLFAQWKNLLHDVADGKKHSDLPPGHWQDPPAELLVEGTNRSVTGRLPQLT